MTYDFIAMNIQITCDGGRLTKTCIWSVSVLINLGMGTGKLRCGIRSVQTEVLMPQKGMICWARFTSPMLDRVGGELLVNSKSMKLSSLNDHIYFDNLFTSYKLFRDLKKSIIQALPGGFASMDTKHNNHSLEPKGIAQKKKIIISIKWWWSVLINLALVNAWKFNDIANNSNSSQLDFKPYTARSWVVPKNVPLAPLPTRK